MAKQELTCDDILKELRAKQYRPIYYLMGEESYYIDWIAYRTIFRNRFIPLFW